MTYIATDKKSGERFMARPTTHGWTFISENGERFYVGNMAVWSYKLEEAK